MIDSDIEDLEHEIDLIKKAEEKLEYALLVQKIINTYITVKNLVGHLPSRLTLNHTSDGYHLLENFYLHSTGLKLNEIDLTIWQNKFLRISKNTKIIFEFSEKHILGSKQMLLEISEKIKLLGIKFQKHIKVKIVELEKKFTEELKNF